MLPSAQNQLNFVSPAIRKPSIRHLDLSFQNCILFMCFAPFELNDESFSGMDNLRVLSLKGNLREVKASYFSSARTLEDLDISSFYLTEIHKDSFLQNSKLRRLTCTQCWFLEAVQPELWSPLTSLEYLDLSYSPHSLITAE